MFNRIPSSLKNLFVSLVLVALLFGGTGNVVHAQVTSDNMTSAFETVLPPAVQTLVSAARDIGLLEANTSGTPGITDIFSTDGLSRILSYFATVVTGWLVVFAGWMLDFSVWFALSGNTYNSPEIVAAWQVLRDITNIIFIFLILYIGIQTILGLSGSDTKKSLTRIIIVALLINFSMVATGIIIDASNVLALGFYDAFPTTSCLTGNDLGNTRSLSCPFAQGASLSEFVGDKVFNEWAGNTNTNSFSGGLASDSSVLVFVILRMIVNIIAAFVLFAAALLFMIRIGVLIFLMIAAPAAVAAWTLPKTAGYTKKWFSALLNQAFFAPLFILLYYVAARFYVSPSYGEGFETLSGFGLLPPLILKFAITIILLVAAIYTAKSLGAKGANYVSSWGKSGVDYAKGRARSTALQTTAPISRQIETSDSRFARTLRSVPLVSRLTGVHTQAARSDISSRESQYKNMDTTTLKNLVSGSALTTPAADKAAMINVLAERQQLNTKANEADQNERFSRSTIEAARAQQEKIGAGKQAKEIKQAAWQYAQSAQARREALQQKPPSSAIEKIGKNFFTLPTDTGVEPADIPEIEEAHKEMQKNFTANHMRKLSERDDHADTLNKFMDKMVEDFRGTTPPPTNPNDVGALSEWLKGPDRNNRALASWVRSNAGKDILATYGIT